MLLNHFKTISFGLQIVILFFGAIFTILKIIFSLYQPKYLRPTLYHPLAFHPLKPFSIH